MNFLKKYFKTLLNSNRPQTAPLEKTSIINKLLSLKGDLIAPVINLYLPSIKSRKEPDNPGKIIAIIEINPQIKIK